MLTATFPSCAAAVVHGRRDDVMGGVVSVRYQLARQPPRRKFSRAVSVVNWYPVDYNPGPKNGRAWHTAT